MRVRVATLAVSAIALLAVSGCTPNGPGPSLSPSPTVTLKCKDVSRMCTVEQMKREAKAAADHMAAENAVRKGHAEEFRIYNTGETKATPVLHRYYGPARAAEVTKTALTYSGRHWRVVGAPTINGVRFRTEYPGETEDRKQVLEYCSESRAYVVQNGKRVSSQGPPVFQRNTVSIGFTEGAWKVQSVDDTEVIRGCDEF